MTSGSSSESSSYSSIYAIIAHFDEASGALEEGGYNVPQSTSDSIIAGIRAEIIRRIIFWGLNESKVGKAYLALSIDWETHQVVVDEGDLVRLPHRDGVVYLKQIQNSVKSFLRAYNEKKLTSAIRWQVRTDMPKEQYDGLDKKYGWASADPIIRGEGVPVEGASRYHKAVTIEQWYDD